MLFQNTGMAPFDLPEPEYKTVNLLRQHGTLSRTDIAELTGYSRSKITSVVGELIHKQIVEEGTDGESSGGRRPRELAFRADFGYVVAVNVETTSLDVALVDFKQRIRVRQMLPIDVREGPAAILGMICDFILGRLEQLHIPISKVFGFGIGVPGLVDFETGLMNEQPNMPGWGAYQIRSFIRESFPYAVVTIENNANLMALGAQRPGANANNCIFIKISADIRAGIICNGEIYRGVNGCAGNIGYTYIRLNGSPTHLEAVASETAMVKRALAAQSDLLKKYIDLFNGKLTLREIGIVASEGDAAALNIIHEASQLVGEVVANLVNFFNPSLILIGGAVSSIGHQFLAPMRMTVLECSPSSATQHLRIEVAAADAGITGATALALKHVFRLGH